MLKNSNENQGSHGVLSFNAMLHEFIFMMIHFSFLHHECTIIHDNIIYFQPNPLHKRIFFASMGIECCQFCLGLEKFQFTRHHPRGKAYGFVRVNWFQCHFLCVFLSKLLECFRYNLFVKLFSVISKLHNDGHQSFPYPKYQYLLDWGVVHQSHHLHVLHFMYYNIQIFISLIGFLVLIQSFLLLSI